MTYEEIINTILGIMKASGMRDRGWELTDDFCAQMCLDEGNSYFYIQFEDFFPTDSILVRYGHISKSLSEEVLWESCRFYYSKEELENVSLQIKLECVFESDDKYSNHYITTFDDVINRFYYFAWYQDEKYLYEEK